MSRIAAYEVLQQRRLQVWLVDARQVAYAARRKGDVQDGQRVQRMQRALVPTNIQLTEVISDVMGHTGQAMSRDVLAGERDAKTLAASSLPAREGQRARHRARTHWPLARGAPVRAQAWAGGDESGEV